MEEDKQADPLTADPEIAALLDFEPVVRRCKRHDGWTPDNQRGFIVALALCGHPERAAQSVGRSQGGAWSVRNSVGAEGFDRAWDAAIALYHRRNPPPTPPPALPRPRRGARAVAVAPPPPPPPDHELTDEEEIATLADLMQPLFDKYWYKLKEERTCRLAGRIVEADFCVRQLTFIELAIELGGKAEELLDQLRLGGLRLVEIAATPIGLLLQSARRDYWREKGEPERPPPPPLGAHDDVVSTGEPFEFRPARDGDLREWRRRQDAKERLAAEAQAAWEEKARADAEEWASREGPGDPSGRPLAEREGRS